MESSKVNKCLSEKSYSEKVTSKKISKGYLPSYLTGSETCIVCGDRATGYHYKCITCEGCKGFFRRTVQKSLHKSYRCKAKSRCVINKMSRNHCQMCRYQKCLLAGMATDLVLDEDKRLAKRRLIEHNRELKRIKELKHGFSDCHRHEEECNQEKQGLISTIVQAYNLAMASSTFETFEDPGETTMPFSKKLAGSLTNAITGVVEFAKRLPFFFEKTSIKDQIAILKGRCMEVVMFRCATSYDRQNKKLTLFPSVELTRKEMGQTELQPFANQLFRLAEDLLELGLTNVDNAVLQVIILFNPYSLDVEDTRNVERMQNMTVQAYSQFVTKHRKDHLQHWSKILLKLTEIQQLSSGIATTIMNLDVDKNEAVQAFFMNLHRRSKNQARLSDTMAQLVSEGRQAKINKSAFLQPTNNIIQQSDNMVKATCSRNFQAESIVCRDSVEWAEFLHSLSYSELAISQQNILLHHSLLKGFCRASGDMHTEETFSSKANAFFSYPAKQRAGRFESGSYDRARLGETTSVQTRRRDRHVTESVCPTDNASGTLCLLESCPDTLCKDNLGLSSATVLQPDLSVFGSPFSFFQRLSSFPQQLAFNPYASFLNSGGGGSL